MTKKDSGDNTEPQPVKAVPPAMRAGGAFIALALVLALWTFLEVVMNGWMAPFYVTTRFLLICVAAIIIGASATSGRTQYVTMGRIVILGVALVLLMLSRVLPNHIFMVMGQYWLPSYAIVSLLAGLIIKRQMMPVS
ncbi:hypothetical protein [Corynebacterium pygosceleis]|uniref:Uncharacterized protein n=1 Tax=Corynebacterium pygosceleis TaxID=2800406 RepID=A0A9Q4C6C8_9CORY|nr:hypothetical protein [Corynebacterium pygosceleis]MCK7637036.1 hypothetical protein [Corynebacterium pygosceleis]MCK7674510.1 hypothetical protein [Corynebacterium pygosceleis]MCL0120192.1 hypothetical protein [Corynebacterium pygosceleis]MCX7443736.1 hypothetical protein [Corynebacterium pygosceleis]MCX7467789.1 hypothetical protein [Corynebacterium pygosceleis]